MKKNILLIFMFITLFFVGNNDVFAVDYVCTKDDDDCLESIKSIWENDDKYTLYCLYEVEFKEQTYYNYLYYNNSEQKMVAGSSFIQWDHDMNVFSNQHPYLLDTGVESGEKISKCPTRTFVKGSGSKKAICFDSSKEKEGCVEKNSNFENSKSTLMIDNIEEAKNESNIYNPVPYQNLCLDTNPLKKEYGNMCKYNNTVNNEILVIYYNNKETLITGYVKDNHYIAITHDDYSIYNGTKFANKIGTLSTCPNSLTTCWYSEYSSVGEEDYAEVTEIYTTESAIDGKTKQKCQEIKKIYDYRPCTDEEEPIYDPKHLKCGDLFDEDLTNIINTILKIARIAIILLLIGLITFDFVSATFASSDEKMKKAQGKVIKRIIIAIIIFFVPYLVQFIFNIANEVWTSANYEICGMETETK